MNKEQIDKAIQLIPTYTDDDLVHNWKCATAMKANSDRLLLKPFITAIESERKKRGKVIELADTSIHAPESTNVDTEEETEEP